MNTIKNGTSVSEYLENIKDDHAALRHFFTTMPKGGDIHNHLTGSAYAETYFELAASHKMYVVLETGKLYKEKPKGVDGTVIQLYKEMDDLHNHRMALIDKWSIRNFQPYKYPLGPDEYFFGTFGLLSALTSIQDYDDNFALGNLANLMHELKVRAVFERVQYLEVMGCSPIFPKYCFLEEKQYKYFDKNLKEFVEGHKDFAIMALLKEIYLLFEKNAEAQKSAHNYLEFVRNVEKRSNNIPSHLTDDISGVLCRYQGYASRGGEPLEVFTQLYIVFKACQEDNGKLLTGCNLVAAENGEKSMIYYRLHMLMFRVLNEQSGYSNISLHAGELSLGLVRPEYLIRHIEQAITNGHACRIGHGVDLPFESQDYILSIMREDHIPVEINLTSNEFILGVKDSEHPILLYHKAGVPLIISTDDLGILRTSLTEQYTLAVLRYGFKYDEIKEIVHNSIKYAFLNEEEKTTQLSNLDALFDIFEKNICAAPETAQPENGN